MKRRDFLHQSTIATAAAAVGAMPLGAVRGALEQARSAGRAPAAGAPAAGPLRVHPDNPRYFTDGSGRAVYLTGSHTWNNLQDVGFSDSPPAFDYSEFISFLQQHNHNFCRLWVWESTRWATKNDPPLRVAPLPFERTGPGQALDGKPKFDLTRFNQAYFDRLRRRVETAREAGVYVAVMLFQGFSVARKSESHRGSPWPGHPLNGANNVNGVDGDVNGDDQGYEVHTLRSPEVTKIQAAYVRKVIDTVGDLDNVLWEISNESHGDSAKWQYHMIDLIHRYERTRLKRHPVMMTFTWDGMTGMGNNADLFSSPAEAISPARDDDDRERRPYKHDPPGADGSKVIILDTDHLWGIGGSRAWVWKSFLRGMNPIFMDPYKAGPGPPFNKGARVESEWAPLRRAMGHTRTYATRMNLATMVPRSDLASTTYCLAHAGSEYLVYAPDGGRVTVDLSAASGKGAVEWFDPRAGKVSKTDETTGGARRPFTAPFPGDAVLYITTN